MPPCFQVLLLMRIKATDCRQPPCSGTSVVLLASCDLSLLPTASAMDCLIGVLIVVLQPWCVPSPDSASHCDCTEIGLPVQSARDASPCRLAWACSTPWRRRRSASCVRRSLCPRASPGAQISWLPVATAALLLSYCHVRVACSPAGLDCYSAALRSPPASSSLPLLQLPALTRLGTDASQRLVRVSRC